MRGSLGSSIIVLRSSLAPAFDYLQQELLHNHYYKLLSAINWSQESPGNEAMNKLIDGCFVIMVQSSSYLMCFFYLDSFKNK